MRPAPGFTLIEVMVALAIVAITLGAGIKAAGALTGNTQRLADATAAQWCADNQLTGLRLSGLTPPIGESEFSCVELGQTYSGTRVVKLPANPNFRVVEVQIADDAGQQILTLSTVMRK
jgi:general secretion pathway protein I